MSAHRALTVLAVAVAGLLFGVVTGNRLLAFPAALLALTSVTRPSLSRVSTPAQALLLIACGMMALALEAVFPAERGLGDRELERVWAVLGGGALLFAAIRTHIQDPEGGLTATLALGLVVFLGSGSVISGVVYPALLIPYVGLCFAALRADDLHRPRWRDLGWRHTLAVILCVTLSGALTTALVVSVPRWYESANAWALRWWKGRARSGFHDGAVTLTSLQGLLQSDRIVMRIEGPLAEPLRGNVYARYSAGHWQGSRFDPEVSVHDREPLAGDPVTVIRYAGSKLDRFFLPGDVSAVQFEPTRARVDAAGVVRAFPQEPPDLVHLRAGPHPRFRIAGPTAYDLVVPDEIAAALEEIAGRWTEQTTTPAEKLAAIRLKLEQDYRYSLSFERDHPGLDPVLDFLLNNPQGHCEYFASAMALLSRVSGIPARFVTGYLPTERNPFSGHWVVRERHAHAWVEAHLPGRGWVTVDPSPIDSFEGRPPATTAWLPALLDLAVLGWQKNGPVALSVLLLVIFVGIQIARLLRRAGPHRRRGPVQEGPPSYVAKVLGRLRDWGVPHREAESLEAYARRLGSVPVDGPVTAGVRDPRRDAARLLVRYAALRYGDVGNREGLRSEFQAWLSCPGTSARS